jgi:hypothetical protein
MSEYKVELVQLKINKLDVMIALEEATALQMNSQYSASVFEPNDATDPTALIKVECSFKDVTGKMLVVTCDADLVFNLDPIPEDRIEILSQNTRDIIQNGLTERITTILNAMGHKIAFGEN